MPDEENPGLNERDETVRRLSEWARRGGLDRRGGGEELPHEARDAVEARLNEWVSRGGGAYQGGGVEEAPYEARAAFEAARPCLRKGALFEIPNQGLEIDRAGGHPVVVVRSPLLPTDLPEVAMNRLVIVSVRNSWKVERQGMPPAKPQILPGGVFTPAGGPFDRPGLFRRHVAQVPARLFAGNFMDWLLPREVAQLVVGSFGGGDIGDPYPPESCP